MNVEQICSYKKKKYRKHSVMCEMLTERYFHCIFNLIHPVTCEGRADKSHANGSLWASSR